MEKEQKLNLMKDRQKRLSNSEKNIKCPGTLKKLNRQIRNLNKEEN